MNPARRKPRRQLLYDDPVDCGIFTVCKNRKIQDDTRTVAHVHHNITPSLSTYAMFVGHGGSTASELCSRNFIPTLLDNIDRLKENPEEAIKHACNTLEAFVLAKSALDKIYYGSTLLFTLMIGSRLYISNIGNSRAILSTLDGTIYTLTHEHDISNIDEVSRVRAAGGFFHDGKVNNLIRVTRSIGDLELKGRKHITFPNLSLNADIIIATPDIFTRKLTYNDHFIVMATPEIWQYLTNKIVCQIVRNSLRRRESSRIAAKRVTSAAISEGATGPLTVMVLVLLSGKVLSSDIEHTNNQNQANNVIYKNNNNNEININGINFNTNLISNSPIERRHTHFGTRASPGKRLAANALRAKAKWGTSLNTPSSAPVSPAASVRRHKKKPERGYGGRKVSDFKESENDNGGIIRAKVELPQLLQGAKITKSDANKYQMKLADRNFSPSSTNYQHSSSKGESSTTTNTTTSNEDNNSSNQKSTNKNESSMHSNSSSANNSDVTELRPLANARFMLSKLATDVKIESPRGSGRITHSRTTTATNHFSRKQHHLLKQKQRQQQLQQQQQQQQRVQSALECGDCLVDVKASNDNNMKVLSDYGGGERKGEHNNFIPGVGLGSRRYTAQSKDSDSNTRRGSGKWPMSDLTSSSATGRPSSSHVSGSAIADSDRHAVDINGLDYGAIGPSKVRYREDGTVQHNRLGFFRDIGWNLGRRR